MGLLLTVLLASCLLHHACGELSRGSARHLLQGTDMEQRPVIVNLPADKLADVAAQLEAAGGAVLQSLNSGAVVVSADKNTISALVASHAGIRARNLNPAAKVFDQARRVLDNIHQLESPKPVPQVGATAAPKPYTMRLSPSDPVLLLLKLTVDIELLGRDNCTATVAAGLAPIVGNGQLVVDIDCNKPALAVPLTLFTPTSTANEAADWLSKQPWVLTMDVIFKPTLNNMAAAGVTQNGASYDTVADVRKVLMPFWKKGITGAGVTVAVVDTGVDMDNAMFWDDATPHRNYDTDDGYLFHGTYKESPMVYAIDNGGYYGYLSTNNYTKITYYKNLAARKVTHYIKTDYTWDYTNSKAQTQDMLDTAGHGSHTACTVAGLRAGTSTTSPDYTTGMAPDAKLAIWDVDTPCCGLGALFDTEAFFNTLYTDFGIRIVSNSWGSDWASAGYTPSSCLYTDTYLWENQEQLVVFSAGNAGDVTKNLATDGNVGHPGRCKNVLSVGCTYNLIQSGYEKYDDTSYEPAGMSLLNATSGTAFQLGPQQPVGTTLTFKVYDGANTLLYTGTTVALYWYGVGRFTSGGTYEVMMASPSTACSAQSNAGGKVLLFTDNTDVSSCGSDTKANVVSTSGAVGGVQLTSDGLRKTQYAFASQPYTPTVFNKALVSMLSTTNTAGNITHFLAYNGVYTVKVTIVDAAMSSVFGSTTTFSSFNGIPNPNTTIRATQDLRIKPDIVAPGASLLSAWTSGTLERAKDALLATSIQGTSMSAPHVSGTAALVMQYFQAGFYPTGAPTSATKFTPSAPLMKAVLLTGAQPLSGWRMQLMDSASGLSIAQQYNVDPKFSGAGGQPPDTFQGYGRMDLSRTLPIVGGRGWTMQVLDRTAIANGKSHVSTIVANGVGPLIVTLVWADYPSTGTDQPVTRLINNLDLKVSAVGTKYYWWGNMGTAADTTNNVERVVINKATSGTKFQISVTAASIASPPSAGPQKYSLVILGGFTAATPELIVPGCPLQLNAPSAAGLTTTMATYVWATDLGVPIASKWQTCTLQFPNKSTKTLSWITAVTLPLGTTTVTCKATSWLGGLTTTKTFTLTINY